ncbi:molybdenum cofactor synthesis domain-containing protein [Limimaricola soesokkakensis]|uniref:Molybdenum cofactor synthesis domain-containing protein n=1 Tax=Limimaricola soesokkakensis TaxID=1343159 RepID=A0A1X6YQF5_9RHOB|nr:molybdopterin-binding protein [Limimaricola soesokkakensis]PSK88235.1 molybdenum cofactor synthesis domain-containing protein [Limimaricola soesokkakensis]SLN28249.1 NMN amidohydrolase-like protein YfaY [Limimaricola soesokkakensis]
MTERTSNPTAAMLVIGDEILSGRTRDSNMNHLARELTLRGIDLREARVISDDHDAIVAAVRELLATHDHLFTSGGIGPTHDDITAEAVAAAMETPIDVRDDARAILAAHYEARGVELNAARLRMARIPDGATLIDNPVSAAPGFSLRNVHVMAGVPRIFEAMLAGLLPTIPGGRPVLSQSLRVERGEGDVAEPLSELARAHPTLAIGSYPFTENGVSGTNVVIRGSDGAEIEAALVQLSGWLEA